MNHNGTEEIIEGIELVVVTVGMQPSIAYEEELREKVNLCKIGDCHAVGKMMDAIHSAFECARLL